MDPVEKERIENAYHLVRDPDFEWTKQDAKLIILVQKNAMLWNKHHEEYKRKDKAMYVWRNIAKQLGTSAAEVKHRFETTLRKKYVSESKKPSRSGDGLDESKWEHLEAISFLDSTITRRKGKSNIIELLVDLEESSRDSSFSQNTPIEISQMDLESSLSSQASNAASSNFIKDVAPVEGSQMILESSLSSQDNTTMKVPSSCFTKDVSATLEEDIFSPRYVKRRMYHLPTRNWMTF
uniref:CSON012705 protein n=1 Tax=Culicoides sonorensis TaxID=179676 RepID=A0A336M6C4_CULSO